MNSLGAGESPARNRIIFELAAQHGVIPKRCCGGCHVSIRVHGEHQTIAGRQANAVGDVAGMIDAEERVFGGGAEVRPVEPEIELQRKIPAA